MKKDDIREQLLKSISAGDQRLEYLQNRAMEAYREIPSVFHRSMMLRMEEALDSEAYSFDSFEDQMDWLVFFVGSQALLLRCEAEMLNQITEDINGKEESKEESKEADKGSAEEEGKEDQE